MARTKPEASCGEKSYVAMGLCPICHEENGEIIMDTMLRDRFCKYVKTPHVCPECKEKYLQEGVLLIAPESDRIVVVKDEAFNRMFNIPIPKEKTCFVEEAVMDLIFPDSIPEQQPCST